jgi:hypothetical protein
MVVALLLVLNGCGKDDTERGRAAGGTGDNALPAPAGAPGASVTGMPTDPPPPTIEAPSAEPVVADALDPAPELPTAGGEPAGPGLVALTPQVEPPAPAAPAAVDPAGAAGTMREYAAALGSGAFARVQQLWLGAPGDGPVLQLARSGAFVIDVHSPGRIVDGGGGPMVSVPVEMSGVADDGGEQRISAVYTVRLTPEGQWRIAGVSMRVD